MDKQEAEDGEPCMGDSVIDTVTGRICPTSKSHWSGASYSIKDLFKVKNHLCFHEVLLKGNHFTQLSVCTKWRYNNRHVL